MGKDIVKIYKHSASQLSTLSLKTPVSSFSEPQTSSAIELTTTYVPFVTEKNQKNLFCVPKIPYRMMQPSKTMIKYSLMIQQKQL